MTEPDGFGEPDEVTDSDPSGNTPHGLAGGMGISSERVGHLREGGGEGTHGAGVPHPGAPEPATDQQDPPVEEQPELPPAAHPTQGAPNPLGPGPDHEPSDGWRTRPHNE